MRSVQRLQCAGQSRAQVDRVGGVAGRPDAGMIRVVVSPAASPVPRGGGAAAIDQDAEQPRTELLAFLDSMGAVKANH